MREKEVTLHVRYEDYITDFGKAKWKTYDIWLEDEKGVTPISYPSPFCFERLFGKHRHGKKMILKATLYD